MAWFKVDDNFYDHPKVDELSLEAVGVWLLCGTYSARHLTDGFIPNRRAYRMGATDKAIQELISAGLWHEVDDGYQFHNWAEYQPTRDSVEEARQKERDRKRKYRRDKQGQYTGQQPDVPKVSQRDSTRDSQRPSVQPDPTRPDPLVTPTQSRKTAIPKDWHPTQDHSERAQEKNLDVLEEAEKFKNHALSVDRKAVRWNHAFTNWLINAKPRPAESSFDPWKT